MKRNLLLLLLLFAAISARAYDSYSIQVFTNTGVELNGNIYLQASSTSSAAFTTAVTNDCSWSFIPVGSASPGLYYIKNTNRSTYLATDAANITLVSDPTTVGNRSIWRLIKVAIGSNPNEESMYFKLVSLQDSDPNNGGGQMLYRSSGNAGGVSATYTTENSVFRLNSISQDGVGKGINKGQELVSNYQAVSASVLDGTQDPTTFGSNSVWLNLPPAAPTTTNWNEQGGDLSTLTPTTGHYYRMAPAKYSFTEQSSDLVKLMYGWAAAGNSTTGGYYFTRLTATTQAIYQNVSIASGTISPKLALWVRAVGDHSLMTADAEGYYHVGTATIYYNNNASSATADIKVLASAFATAGIPNDPNAWSYNLTTLSSALNNQTISKIEVAPLIGTGLTALDVDNIDLIAGQASSYRTFLYKFTGTQDQQRQNVHEYEQVIYTKPGSSITLATSTTNYNYYRWYKLNHDSECTLTSFNQLNTSYYLSTNRGQVYVSTSQITEATICKPIYTVPSTAGFFSSADATIFCDIAYYKDYDNNATAGTLLEPTVSVRNIFKLRPASEIANAIQDSIGNNSVLEQYVLDAPAKPEGSSYGEGSRIRLKPNYSKSNYWVNVGGVPTQGNFVWYQNTTPLDPTSAATQAAANSEFYDPTAGAREQLQIRTNGKAGTTENYILKLRPTGGATDGSADVAIATFLVTYYAVNQVGPLVVAPATQDIFSSVTNKKEVNVKTFDQLGLPSGDEASIAISDLRLCQDNAYTYKNMGVKPLELDESNYGFTSPLYYDRTNTATSTNLRTQKVPFWSEYGFPQQINGLTNGFGWSNGGTYVDDITYLRDNSVRGNMLYIDAAQAPGKVSSLLFSESFCVGVKLYFSAFIVNLNNASTTIDNIDVYIRPNLVFVLKVIDENGVESVVKRFYTGDIGYNAHNTWHQIGFQFDVPDAFAEMGQVDFRLDIYNNGLSTSGNDFAIDEIAVYRSNPAIEAFRTSSLMCLPEEGAEVSEALDMRMRINLTDLNPTLTELYYRFLSPDPNNEGEVISFPQTDGNGNDVYVNEAEYATGNYWYGRFIMSDFATTANAEGRYPMAGNANTFYTIEDGDKILSFIQPIPSNVLTESGAGNYWIYVGEGFAALTNPDCSGSANFEVKYDTTSFVISVGVGFEPVEGPISACTNSDVLLSAYATQPETGDQMYAYYDWYPGPINTAPAAALSYRYSAHGDTEIPVYDKDGFDMWLASSGGLAWLADPEGGADWSVGQPNYVGYNQFGSYFNQTFENGAYTVTRVALADFAGGSDTDFRTLKNDLRAFRFFYPYAVSVDAAEVTDFPAIPSAGDRIDFETGYYYDSGNNRIDNDYTSSLERFSLSGYQSSTLSAFMTNNKGTYIDVLGNVVSGTARVPYINSLDDLQKLVARIQYWVANGYLVLHDNDITIEIASMASQYQTAVPLSVAFNLSNNLPDFSAPIQICSSPGEVSFKAETWSPDAKFGEVNNNGGAAMPYGDISDENYLYTVRLPEKSTVNNVEIATATQFVTPVYRFNDAKMARVRLMKVIDENGTELALPSGVQPIVTNSFIGLINPADKNKLATDIQYTFAQGYNTTDKSVVNESRSVNLRWQLNTSRTSDNYHALEAYPLLQNAYNYYFSLSEPSAEKRGTPFNVGATLGSNTVANNHLAIEVMANDEALRSYVNAANGAYYFKPGYTYQFRLEATAETSWAQSSSCDKTADFALKVVPDVLIWGGDVAAADAQWNLDNNWYMPTVSGNTYTDIASMVPTFPPLAGTKVIIPAALDSYSTLEPYSHLVATLKSSYDNGHADFSTGYDVNRKVITMEPVGATTTQAEHYVKRAASDYSTTPYIEFDYNYLPNTCNTIYFKHGGSLSNTSAVVGGQLGRQDLLTYNSAKVDLNVTTMQWHSLSAPLRSMYSGDYAYPNANPLTDMRLFNTSSPQTGAVSSNWTSRFINAIVPLTAAKAYSIYVSKLVWLSPVDATNLDLGYQVSASSSKEMWDNASLTFPVSTLTFKHYNATDKSYLNYSETISNASEDRREFMGRFVYEQGDDNTIADPLLTVPVTTNGVITNGGISEDRAIILGNPFMANVDFAAFYKANSTYITPQYKILTSTIGKYNTERYSTYSAEDNGSGGLMNIISTDGLTNYIAPMQSFVVFVKSNVTTADQLIFEGNMSKTSVNANTILRAPARLSTSRLGLKAQSTSGIASEAKVVFANSNSNAYYAMEDARLMVADGISSQVPSIYTIADNIYLDINRMNEQWNALPVGLKNGTAGMTKIIVTDATSIPLGSGEELLFKDLATGLEYPLEEDYFEYEFNYDGTEQVGRFFIVRVPGVVTPIDPSTNGTGDLENGGLSVYQNNNVAYVSSVNEKIKTVELFDLKGQMLFRADNVDAMRYALPLQKMGTMFVLRATTENYTANFKIVNH